MPSPSQIFAAIALIRDVVKYAYQLYGLVREFLARQETRRKAQEAAEAVKGAKTGGELEKAARDHLSGV